MGWTVPRTWVTGEVATAATFNTHLRDDLTALQAQSAVIATSQATASAAYVDLATVGPAVTLNTGTQVLLSVGCNAVNNGTGGAVMSVAVSGATTIAASDAWGFSTSGVASLTVTAGMPSLFTGLTAGSNTFTCKYRSSSGTSTFAQRNLIVTACY